MIVIRGFFVCLFVCFFQTEVINAHGENTNPSGRCKGKPESFSSLLWDN